MNVPCPANINLKKISEEMYGGFLNHLPQLTSAPRIPTHTHVFAVKYTFLKKWEKRNTETFTPLALLRFTYLKEEPVADGCMNKYFHVTMPLTHCTLTVWTHSILYQITNPANYLAGVDSIQWNRVYSPPFVPGILWWFLWVNFEPRKINEF